MASGNRDDGVGTTFQVAWSATQPRDPYERPESSSAGGSGERTLARARPFGATGAPLGPTHRAGEGSDGQPTGRAL